MFENACLSWSGRADDQRVAGIGALDGQLRRVQADHHCRERLIHFTLQMDRLTLVRYFAGRNAR